jgi:hypothetical protein
MIKMSGSRQIRLIVANVWLALAVAGCCGGGSTHKCDFTPPSSMTDAGPPSDGGTSCGTEICPAAQVCCVTKAPLAALCVDRSEFQSRQCETSDLPCGGPAFCPKAFVCCLTLVQQSGTATCKSQDLCVPERGTTFIVCNTPADCPAPFSTCSQLPADGSARAGVCQ